MIKVNSSNIEAIGYNEETNILMVQFKNGSTSYEYIGVPNDIYLDIVNNRDKEEFSIGRYINQVIKPNYQVRQAVTKESLEKELKKINKDVIEEESLGEDYTEGIKFVLNILVEKFGLII